MSYSLIVSKTKEEKHETDLLMYERIDVEKDNIEYFDFVFFYERNLSKELWDYINELVKTKTCKKIKRVNKKEKNKNYLRLIIYNLSKEQVIDINEYFRKCKDYDGWGMGKGI